jgi:lipopolysaccharide/colanic/teichoic acid biosynthesis glycosyltransferase
VISAGTTRADSNEHSVKIRISPVGRPKALPPYRHWYLPLKGVSDCVIGLLLLVVAGPVIMIGAALVKLTSRGPAFYSQIRVGMDGKLFTIYKLRTMVHNCEKMSGPRWSTPGDTRVTPIGRFLRQSHLDELPQLWNVLVGQMSLIGPRPERPEFVPALAKQIPHYRDRLLIRPGITGLAQVQLAPDTDLDSVRRKLAFDLYYVRQMGPWLDWKILACTALKVFHVPVDLTRHLFRWPKVEHKSHIGLVGES